MKLKGRVHKFGDNVNTDEIIPAKYLNISAAAELAKYCMSGINANFVHGISKGDIIVAGANFGCGSSREHAPVAIKACGISCVVAKSFARIFYRNAINIGLPILECKQARQITDHSIVRVDLDKGIIMQLPTEKIYFAQRFPEFMQQLIKAGGLLKYIRRQYGNG